MVNYTTDEVGHPVYEIPLELLVEESQLHDTSDTPSLIGWYTDCHGVRGDISISMGLVKESDQIAFDLTQPTRDQLISRYGNDSRYIQ
jgi:hypothetical protein